VARLTPNLIAITSTPPVQQGALGTLQWRVAHATAADLHSHHNEQQVNSNNRNLNDDTCSTQMGQLAACGREPALAWRLQQQNSFH